MKRYTDKNKFEILCGLANTYFNFMPWVAFILNGNLMFGMMP